MKRLMALVAMFLVGVGRQRKYGLMMRKTLRRPTSGILPCPEQESGKE